MRPSEPFIVAVEEKDEGGDALDLPSLASMRELIRRAREEAEAAIAGRCSEAAQAA